MPTIDDLIQIKKKSKQATTTAIKSDKLKEETKPKLVKQEKKAKTTKNNETAKLNSVELVESKLVNEEKKKKKYEQMSQVLIFSHLCFLFKTFTIIMNISI
jgi:hypothetical protein